MLQVGRTFGMRDGMLRLQYELQRGSGLMSWRMRSVQGWDSWDLKRITPGANAEDMLATRRDGAHSFFFGDARCLGSGIKKIIGPEGEASVLADAERILAGSLPFFGQLSLASGFPPRWFVNPVTGQSVSPQEPWTQMRFASPSYGDLKFILEPSRFLFIYPLVRVTHSPATSGFQMPSGARWKTGRTRAHRWLVRCGFAGKSARYEFWRGRLRCKRSSTLPRLRTSASLCSSP